jgi:hypothetical protein
MERESGAKSPSRWTKPANRVASCGLWLARERFVRLQGWGPSATAGPYVGCFRSGGCDKLRVPVDFLEKILCILIQISCL